MARTVGERDRARGAEISRPRQGPSSSQRRRAEARTERKQSGRPRRPEDAETVDEALDIEREIGERKGAASRTVRPITTYGKPLESPADRASSRRSGPSLSGSSARSAGSVGGIGAALAADVFIITANEIATQHRAPIPSRLLVAFGVFGVLGLSNGQARRPALALAWGIVIATLYSAAPGKKPPALNALAALGDFLGGKYGTPAAAQSGPIAGADASVPGPRSQSNGESLSGRGSFAP